MRVQAAVLYGTDEPFRLDQVNLDGPGPGQVLVEVAGAGICQSDLLFRTPGVYGEAGLLRLPAIAGHEGAGVIVEVGQGVRDLAIGDHVVLTFDSCGGCANCLTAHPAYCMEFQERNGTGREPDGSTPVRDSAGAPVSARWFQQSSFATHALATTRNAIVVDRSLPLELLGPLGCGVQTGAGTVFTELAVQPGSSLVVWGAGTVGLSAVMAAKVAGAGQIIAVDLHDERLDLARELGATHALRGDDPDVAERVRAFTGGGARYGIEATGMPEVAGRAIASLATRGVLALVGLMYSDLVIGPMDLAVGRTLIGVLTGDSVPGELIPRLIGLWQQGRFPFDRLISHYPLSAINQAEQDMLGGAVVKPVLLPRRSA
ncbi:NAD(P)-dependent alcohol dehydrogenase [Amycolatopsis sp. cg5]|uniref:NAD(P)-dependent alcohol dehydrogenase n=1 Tax=Amycolatopsis sp. cg5 TaxID=3238802 RepID=UPI003525B220